MPTTKRGYLPLIRFLAWGIQAVRLIAEATTEKFAEQEAKLSELNLKVPLLAEEVGWAGNLQKYLTAGVRKLKTAKRKLVYRESILKEKSDDNDRLEVELWLARSELGQCRG